MKQIFLTLLSRLWNLTSPEVEPMGKNRAMKLILAKDLSSSDFRNTGGNK